MLGKVTAWRFNRHLIRFALNLAAKNISDDPTVGIRVRIDADTEGVLGHVPVTDTILKKIAVCDAFVPDLTFVALTDPKLVPNPNVMLEYGYALRAKSPFVMIPVMNTAYGAAERLPFDMAHLRHPLQYHLPATATNAERRTVRKALAEEFERILRLMIDAASAVDEREAIEKSRQQEAARRYLAPELYRTIDRALYIHSRAIPNFVSASVENSIKPNDRKEDFLPYRPVLYPHAPQVRELSADDAAALSAFYDSLQSLADFVIVWWGREGQLPVNIFNMILHNADKSLRFALICIKEFDLEQMYPPQYEAWGTISSRIERSLSSAEEALKHHIARFEAKSSNKATPLPQKHKRA